MIGAWLPTLAPVIKRVFASLFPDEEKAREAEEKLLSALLAADKGQVQVNQVEAAHRSLFVAGWRPWIGWICGMGLLWAFVILPIVVWVNGMMGWQVTMPPIQTDYLLELVMAMLGLSGLRSFEKMKRVAR
ncbi:MAG: hypothetical protein GDA50_02465 [Alphaproteobacteria bacterium GM202ARS2]|nr:hypothetical protein [Alphaproteobacteria bacterium GM202ARS2]